MVSVAGVKPGEVVREKSVPQAEPSPATPPAELMQVERMSAMVLIWATGTVTPGGTPTPGDVPVVVFASSSARMKALARAVASSGAEPMAEGEERKGARA
jgi:hypothetical protein